MIVQSGTTATGFVRNTTGQTQTFTIDASAPGAATTGGPIALGPLTLQGPSIGLADFGFADGMVVLTIAVGVDRASLAFGGTATSDHHRPERHPDQQRRHRRPRRRPRHLRPRRRRARPAQRQRPHRADRQVEPAGRLAHGRRAQRREPERDRASSSATTRTAATTRSSSRSTPPPSASRAWASPDACARTTRRWAATSRSPTTTTLAPGITPGLVIRGNGFSLGTAELAYGLPLGADGLPVDENNARHAADGRREDHLRRGPRARRHPDRRLRPHRHLRRRPVRELHRRDLHRHRRREAVPGQGPSAPRSPTARPPTTDVPTAPSTTRRSAPR